MDSLQMPALDSEDSIDTYYQFNRSKRSSMASIRSESSPYNPSTDSLTYNSEQTNNQRIPSKKGVNTFISKLYSMVVDARYQNLISWNPSGTSFFVCNATQFAQKVLPEYFKHGNFSSFVRLLNMYGFHKINKSPRGQRENNENEIWEFSHPKFQHGRSDILKGIKRKAMDSEFLRRETGDIHASFAMLQMSQADLLQQFRILQENFSGLLRNFEESKRLQAHQQAVIHQLAERQGMSQAELMQLQDEVAYGSFPHHQPSFDSFHHNSSVPDSNTESPLTVFVTSPAEPCDKYNPMQFFNDHVLQHPLQTTQEITMSMYETINSPSPSPLSPLDNLNSMPLPPSPVPSIMVNSPHPTEILHDPQYNDINTLGLSLSS